MDTIFALATASGRAGVAIVRISGPNSFQVASSLCGSVPASRGLRRLVDKRGELIDECFVLTFNDGNSFTGEPVVEFQLHGSMAIVNTVLAALASVPGARLAEPGEFTRRALENGKLDLAQVEGLADLIDAETESQRRQAIRVFEGGLGEKAEEWRKSLIRATALMEATIDFVDEDVPVDVFPEVMDLITNVKQELRAEVKGSFVAERVKNGFEVAIVGRPNVGKSTLLNRLAGRDAAIISDVAGTTRDVIEVHHDLNGIPVTFIDTAGIRNSDDKVEILGISRALERSRQSDVRILLLENNELEEFEVEPEDLIFRAKADVHSDEGDGISGLTGFGVDLLLTRLERILSERVSSIGVAIRERHRVSMEACLEALAGVELLMSEDAPVDLISEDLKVAVRSVDMIVGRVDVEDLLGEIFSSFCIGK